MEIEKRLVVGADAAKVWQLILDPKVMGACVPGVESTEVISDTEYVSHVQVKISFISARFKIRTKILEQREHEYLRTEGVGEDASVASSLKQASELFLVPLPDGRTELRMKIQVDVYGRLGAFGLSVMKTRADRMWDEFGEKLNRIVSGAEANNAENVAPQSVQTSSAAPISVTTQAPAQDVRVSNGGWFQRLFGREPAPQPAATTARNADEFRVEIRDQDRIIVVHWPIARMADSAVWLREYLK